MIKANIASRLFWGGLLFMSLGSVQAQTIVSKEPGVRTVIMEEFTGSKCTNCPQGHKISDGMHAMYPGRYIAINIHASSLAAPDKGEPDLRTPYSDPLASMVRVEGLPQATVNRTWFKGQSGMPLNRQDWQKFVSQEMDSTPIVNVAAKITVDYKTRKMICETEAYYVKGSSSDVNALHIALLQNNVISSQQGAEYYREMMTPDGKYRHNHILREFITGLKGDSITTTNEGSFIAKTYEYTIPDSIYGLPYDIGQMDVAIFITESDNKKILNGAIPQLKVLNVPTHPVILESEPAQVSDCSAIGGMRVKILNKGLARIDAITCETEINGKKEIIKWEAGAEGTPAADESYVPMEDSAWCTFTHFSAEIGKITEVKYTITEVNGAAVVGLPSSDISSVMEYEKKVYFSKSMKKIKIVMNLDQYGSEISWKLSNGSGEIIKEQKYEVDLEAPGTQTFEHELEIPHDDCYILDIYDIGKDGFNNTYGEGSYSIYDENGKLILEGDAKFTASHYELISIGNVPTEDFVSKEKLQRIKLYPNPSRNDVKVIFSVNTTVNEAFARIYNISGSIVMEKSINVLNLEEYEMDINTSSLPQGLYILRMEDRQGNLLNKPTKLQKIK